MSLKRILGTVLATRMAGRGRRGGGGLASSMLGGRGYRRRSSMGGKAGLAAMGFMAYRAYRDHQARTPGGTQTASAGATGAGTASAGSTGATQQTDGGIGGMVNKIMDKINEATSPSETTSTGTTSAAAAPTTASPGTDEASDEELREDEPAADNISDDKALLLIRAMITAAYSDGQLSTEERTRIMGEINEAGDPGDREVMEREIANPKPLDELLTNLRDQETAQEFYLASSAAVDGETDENRAYLADLRRRLEISDVEADDMDEMTA